MTTVEEISKRLKEANKTAAPTVVTSRERPPTKDELIVRQNSLAHADEWFKIQSQRTVVTMEHYFATAERIEDWVNRKVSE